MAGADNAPAPDLHEDPVLKRTWFHTGAFPGMALSDALAPEFFSEPGLLMPSIAPAVEETRAGRPTDRIESHCVLKGSTLREEIYGLDRTAAESIPYSIAAHGYLIRTIAPCGANEFGVFQSLPTEAVQVYLERSLDDPRIAHTFNLQFDDQGRVLQAASIAYGRRASPAGVAASVVTEQQRSWVHVSTTRYTGDVSSASHFRLRQECERSGYELANLLPPKQFITGAAIASAFASAPDMDYGAPPRAGITRRLLWLQRTLFASDPDISKPAPLLTQGALGLAHESWEVCFDATLRQSLYGADIAESDLADAGYVKDSDLIGAGLFPAGDPTGRWWRSSGHCQYAADPVASFFRPVAYVDSMGSRTQVREYRDYYLLVDQVTDAELNVVTATEIDFFVVQPKTILDINRNVSSVRYDRLGLIAGSAVMGKGAEGDSFAGFITDPTDAQIDAFFVDPVGQARALLGRATSRVVSDHHQIPNWSAVIGRATHDYDQIATGVPSPLQIAFEYTDGFGRSTLRKLQAEPGAALVLTGGSRPAAVVDASPAPRWVGTGRTVANNKGDPVLFFEPYFSTTHRFDDWDTLGAAGHSLRKHYDPLGRAKAIDYPDGSNERTEFDCWSRTSYDRNDTVLASQWYARRSGGALGAAQLDAANKAAVHDGTTTLVHLNALGRAVASIAHNRWIDPDTGTPATDEVTTLNSHDIQGQLLTVTDPRSVVVAAYGYDMAGTRAVFRTADAGERWSLADVMGKMALAGDAKLNRTRIVYDVMHRPREFHAKQGAGADRVLERQEYGTAADAAINANGRIKQTYDGGGQLINGAYDFQGNVLKTTRTYLRDPTALPDWTNPGSVALASENHATSLAYDALNRVVSVISPDTTLEVFAYNESNLLETVAVTLPGETQKLFVEDVEYTAKGQRVSIRFGNGTRTDYAYDPGDRSAGDADHQAHCDRRCAAGVELCL